MFRISKSDDAIDRRDPEDETANRDSSHEGSAASSALRWLRGSQKSDDLIEAADDAAAAVSRLATWDPADADDRADADDHEAELELDRPLEAPAADPSSKISEPPPRPQESTSHRSPPDQPELMFDFDDEDDIDDFDDLGDLSGVLRPEPLKRRSVLPEIDLDDLSSLHDIDDGAPADEGSDATVITGKEHRDAGDEPALSDTDRALTLAADDDIPPSQPEAAPDLPAIRPLQAIDHLPGEAPDEDEPPFPKIVLRHSRRDEDGSRNELDESSVATRSSSLALQPIPELQPEPKRPAAGSPDPMPEADADDEPVVDDASLDDDDFDEIEALDMDTLEIDALDMDKTGSNDDPSTDDWHAHLADILGGDDRLDEAGKPDPDDELQAVDEHRTALPVLPLKPGALTPRAAPFAIGSEPETDPAADDGDDVLMPPMPARTVRQLAELGPSSPLPPADAIPPSPEQLSIGIVANVPRLRRFAAIQIGDEAEADRLVQKTIETALADPSTLQPAWDLGLALITLLYRQRQETRDAGSTKPGSPEAAFAFETVLCRGLAGADQFEIHQFARAISRIDEQDRVLLVLSALENLAYHQIADIIQLAAGQIMTRVADARIRLRQALTSDETGSDDAASTIAAAHPREIEIHGYLDGELGGHHMAEIDALVEHDQNAADRLLHYGIQGDLIRRLYAPLLNRPIPGSLLEALSAAARPPRRGFRFGTRRTLLAGAIVLALAGGAAWAYVAPSLTGLISQAMAIPTPAKGR